MSEPPGSPPGCRLAGRGRSLGRRERSGSRGGSARRRRGRAGVARAGRTGGSEKGEAASLLPSRRVPGFPARDGWRVFQSGLQERGQECRGPGSPRRAPYSAREVARGCSQLLWARRCALGPSGWTLDGPDAQPWPLATGAPGSQRHVHISRVKSGDQGGSRSRLTPSFQVFIPKLGSSTWSLQSLEGSTSVGQSPGLALWLRVTKEWRGQSANPRSRHLSVPLDPQSATPCRPQKDPVPSQDNSPEDSGLLSQAECRTPAAA